MAVTQDLFTNTTGPSTNKENIDANMFHFLAQAYIGKLPWLGLNFVQEASFFISSLGAKYEPSDDVGPRGSVIPSGWRPHGDECSSLGDNFAPRGKLLP
jgi:hypothetical protein